MAGGPLYTNTNLKKSGNCKMEKPEEKSMYEQIKEQQEHHQDQFDITVQAAIDAGIGPMFDAAWRTARARGAIPNPWISSMFVLVTGMLMKKFTAGFHPDMPADHREQAISDAKKLMMGYLDQIEASAIKEIYTPHPPESSSEIGASTITPKGKKSRIIMPAKKKFQH
jgi:hypothetical protein